MYAVLFTFVFVLTIEYGRELFARNLLECLRTADIARIRVHFQQWLDLGHARYDTAYRNELA